MFEYVFHNFSRLICVKGVRSSIIRKYTKKNQKWSCLCPKKHNRHSIKAENGSYILIIDIKTKICFVCIS